ncbi:GntR family transcriptional regulator [Nesterenkonia sp. CL21]|uniref:GntR family transcriptional regulator n=1 Tax=unclassified Nesterenkonia TaxID=2629769 RepID=UPI002879AD6F|nr:GntR family transcriptional regulator [Nesterenkonia sp. CL21]MDS2174167.1 GntR family transcriptional regulator [Nesterenkonia sp. CL21]
MTLEDEQRQDQRITDGPEPKHIQLSAAVARLATESLTPGEMIPSERTLMTEYGVSRATVRKAVDSLIVDGLLRRVPGKGTFVVQPRLESRLHLASFTQDMRRRGLHPTTRLISCEAVEPPPEAAASLGMDTPGSRGRAWALTRVRCADGQPIAVETGWYPASLFPDLDRRDLTGSLYDIFSADYGVLIDAAEQTLWGEAADAPTARMLEAEPATPLLVFRRVSHAAGRPAEHVVSRYRGDRYQVHMSLSRDDVSSS